MKRIVSFLMLFCLLAVSVIAQGNHSASEKLKNWQPAAIVTEAEVKVYGLDSCFRALKISDKVFQRMQGKSYGKDCTISRSDLRYLRILHRNKDGKPQLGEMVCHKLIAEKVIKIFRQLYEAGYKIERMVLVDDYDGNDEKSMTANNTSAFNYRKVAGAKILSKHSRGLAVDVNPLYNPCLKLRTGKVTPVAGTGYVKKRNTRKDIPMKIDHQDLCYKLFHENGFTWGGDWKTTKDYQHFEYK